MNRLDDYPEIELTNDIDRSGKVGMYIILFCLVALALLFFGFLISKPSTEGTPAALVSGDTDNQSAASEAQIEFRDTAEDSVFQKDSGDGEVEQETLLTDATEDAAEQETAEVEVTEVAVEQETAQAEVTEDAAEQETAQSEVTDEKTADQQEIMQAEASEAATEQDTAQVESASINSEAEQQIALIEAVDNDVAEPMTSPLQTETIKDVFDSGLIFVSASDPKYIITGDQQRLDVGDEIDEQTLLAGITNENVVLERQGNFIVIELPDPSAEQQ